jgi:DNA segregation ATPase FtsK/SpoIIIE, S-DNA-T family
MTSVNGHQDVTGLDDTPVLEPTVTFRPGERQAEAKDTSYEVQLDDVDLEDLPKGPAEPDGKPVRLPKAGKKRQPIIPAHLNTLEKQLKRAREIWSDVCYHVAFQGIRLVLRYPWEWSWWALRGLGRFVNEQHRWWWVRDAGLLLDKAVLELDGREYRNQHNHVRKIRGWRGTAIGTEAVGLLVAAVLTAMFASGLVQAILCVAAWAGLALLGKPKNRTIFTPAMLAPRIRSISGDIIIRAYKAAGLCDPDKPGLELSFPRPMRRDEMDKGTIVVVSAPLGTTYEQVVKARAKIASGLDVKLSQVYISEDDESERTHNLYIADRDPLAEPAGRTPLLDMKPRCIWDEMPFGLDQFGRVVQFCLMWTSVLIGAQPRKGKTWSARLLALWAALDPYVKLLLVDGKMSTDWTMFKRIAHRFVSGNRPSRDGDPVLRLLDVLDEVIKHIDDVNEFLATLDITECPEGKITKALSRKYEVCRVWFMLMEEWQVYFETDDQDVNKLIAAKLSDIKARGPSAGVILVSSTQKPAGVGAGDVNRLANRFRDNHDVRFGLRCASRVVSEAVLGGDAYSEGYDCSRLPLGKRYRGVGILYALFDESPTVRTYLADGEDATAIVDAAWAHRERLGLLTGDAAFEDFGVAPRDVLADVLTVFGDDERLSWDELAERLAERLPDRWHEVDGAAISAQLRNRFRIKPCQVKRAGKNRSGCRRMDVAQRVGAAA